jgi:predicted  nucleic acid-binding Zn-ribbon protein
MSQSFQLFRLQQIDTHLDHARAHLHEIELALSDDSYLRQSQQKLDDVEEQLESAQKALRRAEENVSSQKIKIEQTEASLYGGKIHNPKELQDLHSEADALKRYQGVLDDRLLDAMIALEEVEVEHKTISAELESVRGKVAAQNSKLNSERSALLQEIQRLEGERNAAARSVSVVDLDLYEQLRKQRRGIAVAVVTDKTCSACGSTLSAAQLHAARSPNQLTRCDVCGRILYGG